MTVMSPSKRGSPTRQSLRIVGLQKVQQQLVERFGILPRRDVVAILQEVKPWRKQRCEEAM